MSYVEGLLSEGEEITHVSRQHWFTMVPTLAVTGLLSLLIVGLTIAAYFFIPGDPLFPAVLLIFLVIPGLKLSVDWLGMRSRMLVITNRRVIHVEGFFGKRVLDSSLEKVNDVLLEQSLLGRMFDFGNLEILTASESGANRFERIAEPIKCKTAMLDQKVAGEQATSFAPVADVPSQIAQLAALREKGIITDSEFETKKVDLLRRM